MNTMDIFAFYDIEYEDQRKFQFHAKIMTEIGRKLLNATDNILFNYRLSFPQLVYFSIVKMFLQELIPILERTQHNI